MVTFLRQGELEDIDSRGRGRSWNHQLEELNTLNEIRLLASAVEALWFGVDLLQK